jgi:hypothetical protein
MNLAFLQVPMLESYLQSPAVHVAASRNPELQGGYFVNIDEERSGEVRDLLNSIKRERADMLRFAEAISQEDDLVRQNSTGFDLAALYPKLPAELSGLVRWRSISLRSRRTGSGSTWRSSPWNRRCACTARTSGRKSSAGSRPGRGIRGWVGTSGRSSVT